MTRSARFLGSAALLLMFPVLSRAQNAELSGRVKDPSDATIPNASVAVTNEGTGIRRTTSSNKDGLYTVPSLPPGSYKISVSAQGFQTVTRTGVKLEVEQRASLDFTLPVGAATEVVTVEGGVPLVNTQDAAVSSVVDRNFVENLPMNGRSFQTLIALTPGVVVTPATFQDSGQFSVNGQRASANYFMVDGVSANTGIAPGAGANQATAGAVAAFSALGGTSSLVTVDAMQEFRIQTSTFAPEFGRTPGAQISIVTRSGTNQFHGTLFDYFRNDVLDASDWFSNQKGLRKSAERQNDFGGVLGGPILKNRTFFFLSYEGLRLRLPQTGITNVPSLNARQTAPAVVQPFLKAYPLPNGPEVLNANGTPSGAAPFNSGYSDPATLNAYSLRIDHSFKTNLSVFVRYADAPSRRQVRGGGSALSTVEFLHFRDQNLTAGITWSASRSLVNNFRFNYSKNSGFLVFGLDDFGGAVVPSDSVIFPSPFSSTDSNFAFNISGLGNGGAWATGRNGNNVQRQINVVDDLSFQRGRHSLKFGLDYRRLSPLLRAAVYKQNPTFTNVAAVLAQKVSTAAVTTRTPATLLFNNVGAFAQDTWRVIPRLTFTFGLRWDIDVSPDVDNGLPFLAVTQVSNLATTALAPAGTAVFQTTYGNVAPRVGLAYQLFATKGWETVFRGGFGVFYDLATPQVGDALVVSYPFGATKTNAGATFPLTSTAAAPPTITLTPPIIQAIVFDPKLELPHTLQWNSTIEQALASVQAVRISYVGAVGRRLLQQETANLSSPIANTLQVVGNFATSDYHALQLQFERRMSRGLQARAAYTWSHSLDTASSSSGAITNFITTNANANRGPSAFDIRNTFSAAISYEFPTPHANRAFRYVAGGWGIDNIVSVRSAPPLEVFTAGLIEIGSSLGQGGVRPDVVPGIPLYLFGPQYSGGKILNNTPNQGGAGCKGPFCSPPRDPARLSAFTRQGNFGRNSLRGFGAAQWDFAARRDFHLSERMQLQFRAEFFNVLNHPNFFSPSGSLTDPAFGQSVQMLSRGLGSSDPSGAGLNPLYQIGGPRSTQLALKLRF